SFGTYKSRHSAGTFRSMSTSSQRRGSAPRLASGSETSCGKSSTIYWAPGAWRSRASSIPAALRGLSKITSSAARTIRTSCCRLLFFRSGFARTGWRDSASERVEAGQWAQLRGGAQVLRNGKGAHARSGDRLGRDDQLVVPHECVDRRSGTALGQFRHVRFKADVGEVVVASPRKENSGRPLPLLVRPAVRRDVAVDGRRVGPHGSDRDLLVVRVPDVRKRGEAAGAVTRPGDL